MVKYQSIIKILIILVLILISFSVASDKNPKSGDAIWNVTCEYDNGSLSRKICTTGGKYSCSCSLTAQDDIATNSNQLQ